VRVENLRFVAWKDPLSWTERAGARSFTLPQRIIVSFIQALNFAAVEPLVTNLHAKGFRRSQVLDGVTNGFSRCRKRR